MNASREISCSAAIENDAETLNSSHDRHIGRLSCFGVWRVYVPSARSSTAPRSRHRLNRAVVNRRERSAADVATHVPIPRSRRSRVGSCRADNCTAPGSADASMILWHAKSVWHRIYDRADQRARGSWKDESPPPSGGRRIRRRDREKPMPRTRRPETRTGGSPGRSSPRKPN
jgi:hypothetical protein